MRILNHVCVSLLLAVGVQRASAFALIGPFTPSMTAGLSDQAGGSIGGPMALGEGYRWNVPVVTYAYDASFFQYFGSSGAAAVDSAMQILNNLPPASAVDLNNYPTNTTQVNLAAESQGLVDLKSAALSLLLEQSGLAQPERFSFALRNFSDEGGVTNYSLIMRNYDPVTQLASPNVNGTQYGSSVAYYPTPGGYVADAVEFPVDPGASTRTAVAEGVPAAGNFFTGLSYDDAGGLRYLLSPNNVVWENLLPGVQGYGTNASNYVTTALRPGIDKVTFMRVNYDSFLGQFLAPVTNQYVDRYIANNTVRQQTLQRVITQPDILFTASFDGLPIVSRSGTTNWASNNVLNGGPSKNGPGVIQPPIAISFNTAGRTLINLSGAYPPPEFALIHGPAWGSFDASANAPMAYPLSHPAENVMTFKLLLFSAPSSLLINTQYSWNLAGPPDAHFLLQTSTNLSNWTTITTITNLGGDFTYGDTIFPNTSQRYFRTIPE
jgi:hypothetical protein